MQAERVACKIEIYVDFNFLPYICANEFFIKMKICSKAVQKIG